MDEIGFEVAYPLAWPDGRPRTPQEDRCEGPFSVTLAAAIGHLVGELRKMGVQYITISSNTEGYVRQDVWRPYADMREPEDSGVALYFDLDKAPLCMSCDRWDHTIDNIRSLGKTIEAMRGIERWGSSETMKRAFSGFRAELPPAPDDWRSTLGFALKEEVDVKIVKERYLELARKSHPDHGGNPHDMSRINQALAAATMELSD